MSPAVQRIDGNIWGIKDNLNGAKTQGFTYDSLNRITSFSLGGFANEQYQIDSFGNLTGLLNGQPASAFDPATNHVSNLPCQSAGLPYDAAGNQLCDTDPNGAIRHYVFDSQNRVSQIAVAGNENNPFVLILMVPTAYGLAKGALMELSPNT